MQIETWPIDRPKPYPGNPRNNDAAVSAVASSIREFGWRVPIVVDEHGVILAGHTRLKAAQSLGMAEVPVHIAAGLSEDQARAFRLADNKVSEIAEWNEDALASELSELRLAGFDLELAGFDHDEVDAMLGPGGANAKPDDSPPPPSPENVITQPGDLWILGNHRLLCGDALNPDNIDRVLDGHAPTLCATDPPYIVDYTGERPNGTGKDWSENYREIDIKDPEEFFRSLFAQIKRVIAPGSAIYCWHAHKRCGLIQKIWAELDILDHQSIIWIKPTPVFGRVFWHFRHEPCIMGWVKGSMPKHNGKHNINSVWECPYDGEDIFNTAAQSDPVELTLAIQEMQGSVWTIDYDGKARIVGNKHPTQKPVEIFARPIRRHTKPHDHILEPFSESGSQIIAAETTQRQCHAIELSPAFCDVAVQRWQEFTGKTATRLNNK